MKTREATLKPRMKDIDITHQTAKRPGTLMQDRGRKKSKEKGRKPRGVSDTLEFESQAEGKRNRFNDLSLG